MQSLGIRAKKVLNHSLRKLGTGAMFGLETFEKLNVLASDAEERLKVASSLGFTPILCFHNPVIECGTGVKSRPETSKMLDILLTVPRTCEN